MQTIFQKLFAIQQELAPIAKDLDNPFYKSKYFDVNVVIDHLLPLLKKHDLLVLQPLSHIGEKPAIKTIIFDVSTGELLEDITPLVESSDIQKVGGIVTYTRRYALVALFLIRGEEDDDGETAVGRGRTPPSPRVVPDAPFKGEPSYVQTDGSTCPKCLSAMVLKKGVKGAFKACVAYPKCRYTENV